MNIISNVNMDEMRFFSVDVIERDNYIVYFFNVNMNIYIHCNSGYAFYSSLVKGFARKQISYEGHMCWETCVNSIMIFLKNS